MFKFSLPFELPQKKPKTYEESYNRSLELYQAGKFELALGFLELAESMNPERFETYYTRGVCMQRLARDAEAKAAFQHALMLNTEDSDCLYNIARIFYNEENLDVALGYLELAESLVEPTGDPDIAYMLGLIYEQQKQIPLAIKQYERSLSMNPAQNFVGVLIGRLLMQSGKYDRAADYLKEQVEQDPYNMEVTHLLSLCLAKTGKWAESIRYCQRLIEIAPSYAPAFNQLGLAYYSTERYEEASKSYEQALELDPHFATAMNNLAFTSEKLHNFIKALECFMRYLKYIQNNVEEVAEVEEHIEILRQKVDSQQKGQ